MLNTTLFMFFGSIAERANRRTTQSRDSGSNFTLDVQSLFEISHTNAVHLPLAYNGWATHFRKKELDKVI